MRKSKRNFWDSHGNRTAAAVSRRIVVFFLILGVQFTGLVSRFPLEVYAEVDSPQLNAETNLPQPRYGEPVPPGGGESPGGQPGNPGTPGGSTAGSNSGGSTGTGQGTTAGGIAAAVANSSSIAGIASIANGNAPTAAQGISLTGTAVSLGISLAGITMGISLAVAVAISIVAAIVSFFSSEKVSEFDDTTAPPDEGLTAEDTDTATEAEQGETGVSTAPSDSAEGQGDPGPSADSADSAEGQGDPGAGDGSGGGSGGGEGDGGGSSGPGGPGDP